jgi:hypothetical protein
MQATTLLKTSGLLLAVSVATALAACAQPAEKKAPAPENSPLAKLAVSLKPGTWVVLNQDGDGSGYGLKFTESGVGQGGIFGFASKATYDPVHRRVFHYASGHSVVPPTEKVLDDVMKFIVYEVDTNKWTRLKNAQWFTDKGIKTGNSHGYQLQTIAPGQYFRGWAGRYDFHVCDINKEKLTDIDPKSDWTDYAGPINTPPAGTTARGTLEYFPERNSLFFIDAAGGNVYEKILTSPKWTQLASNVSELTGDGIASAYNPVRKVIVFGGGSRGGRKWRQLDATGKISLLDDAPMDSYACNHALFTVDPNSGKHILIRPTDYQKSTGYLFFELDITKALGSQWTERKDLEAAVPQLNVSVKNMVLFSVVVPLPEYGVVMCMSANKVWLYKHSDKPGSEKQ